jgi:hypothetical protein
VILNKLSCHLQKVPPTVNLSPHILYSLPIVYVNFFQPDTSYEFLFLITMLMIVLEQYYSQGAQLDSELWKTKAPVLIKPITWAFLLDWIIYYECSEV